MAPMPPIPKALSDSAKVEELCELLVPDGTPKTLSIDAPPWAQAVDCIGNVGRMIQQHDGEVVYGWSLIETLPDVMMEAEFHAVWRDENGSLRDVTPKQLPIMEPVTVFLADPDLVYEDQQIDNVRVALQDDQLIRSFIRTSERRFEAWNRGDLANYHGDMRGRITPEMERIEQQGGRFSRKIMERYYSN